MIGIRPAPPTPSGLWPYSIEERRKRLARGGSVYLDGREVVAPYLVPATADRPARGELLLVWGDTRRPIGLRRKATVLGATWREWALALDYCRRTEDGR